jgi:hypothetical protein
MAEKCRADQIIATIATWGILPQKKAKRGVAMK